MNEDKNIKNNIDPNDKYANFLYALSEKFIFLFLIKYAIPIRTK